MKAFNGITERNLVFFFMGLEALVAVVMLAMYLRA